MKKLLTFFKSVSLLIISIVSFSLFTYTINFDNQNHFNYLAPKPKHAQTDFNIYTQNVIDQFTGLWDYFLVKLNQTTTIPGNANNGRNQNQLIRDKQLSNFKIRFQNLFCSKEILTNLTGNELLNYCQQFIRFGLNFMFRSHSYYCSPHIYHNNNPNNIQKRSFVIRTNSIGLTKSFTYNLSRIYLINNSINNVEMQCSTNLSRMQELYKLLLHWIDYANRNHIVWWITFGTLLGSVRDSNIIPYDHDMDISVLGLYEQMILNSSIYGREMISGEINMIKRFRNNCDHYRGLREDCNGKLVQVDTDVCSFCTPLARLISPSKYFFDIFVVKLPEMNDESGNRISYKWGLLDEFSDGHHADKISYSMESVFPLRECKFMGLILPCPQNPHDILTYYYGSNYIKPAKMCSTRTGNWIHVR